LYNSFLNEKGNNCEDLSGGFAMGSCFVV